MEELTSTELIDRYTARQECSEQELVGRLFEIKKRYNPDGFMLLECCMFDSSRFGELTILPFGGTSTYSEPPMTPISPRGLASDMSVVVGVMRFDTGA